MSKRSFSGKFARPAIALGAATLAVFLLSLKTSAQNQGDMTFHTVGTGNGQTAPWPAGPDYATDVLGDPWDFCNDDDVAPDPLEIRGWTSFQKSSSCSSGIGEAGGTFFSVTDPNDAQFSLLFRGRYGYLTPTRNGRVFPIDTSRYKKISYRMNDPNPNTGFNPYPEGSGINWFFYPWQQPNLTLEQQLGGSTTIESTGGYAIYSKNLASGQNGIEWTNGVVRGLRLSPRKQHAPATVFYDWVRLTVNDNETGAAMQRITWSGGTGTSTVTVTDSHSPATVFTLGTVASNATKELTFNYGIFPPGSYTIEVRNGGTLTAQRPFTINTPPIVHLTNPDDTGGEDYATTHMNISNGWDMNASSDVSFYSGLTGAPLFSNSQLRATNSPCVSNCGADPTSDPQIWLLGENSRTIPVTPINTQRYRHFSVRYMTEDPNNTREFGIGRLFWTDAQFLDGNTATHTRDIDTWPGYHTYTLDLASLTAAEDGGLEDPEPPWPDPKPWTSANMTYLRFDPLEFPDSRQFHIDYVKLAADDETSNGGFTFEWTNTGSNSATVSLFLDTDKNPNNGKTQIASGLSAGAHSYFWPQGNTATGRYWVYVESSDGLNTQGRYSTGVLSVTGPTSVPAIAVDTPGEGATVNTTFPITGWAIDQGSQSGPGVNAIHIWAVPQGASGANFVDVGNYGSERADIAGALGEQFRFSGYSANATLAPGNYLLLVYMNSSVTGTFNRVLGRNITVQAPATEPYTRIDAPLFEDTRSLTGSFRLEGWAIDRGSTSGPGVTDIHVWAFKDGQEPGRFVCVGNYFQPRTDIGTAFGDSRFNNSGYYCDVTPSSLNYFQNGERWFFVVFARSSVTEAFSQSAGAWVTFDP